MMRTVLFSLTLAFAGLLAFAAPPQAAAQYGGYPPRVQYPPPPPNVPYPAVPDVREMGGTWYMSGRQDQPCQVIPSRRGDRALFINERGGRAEGYVRGDSIVVPGWDNLTAQYLGNEIRWANGSVWTR